MKPTTLLLIFTFSLCQASYTPSRLLAHCSPQKRKPRYYKIYVKFARHRRHLSDEAWEKLMLSDENNKQHIREAIVAMERNNQSNYWEALGKVECPDM